MPVSCHFRDCKALLVTSWTCVRSKHFTVFFSFCLYILCRLVWLCIQAALQLDESEWSDKFSLDTVGSVGKIECKFKNQNAAVSPLHCRLIAVLIKWYKQCSLVKIIKIILKYYVWYSEYYVWLIHWVLESKLFVQTASFCRLFTQWVRWLRTYAKQVLCACFVRSLRLPQKMRVRIRWKMKILRPTDSSKFACRIVNFIVVIVVIIEAFFLVPCP